MRGPTDHSVSRDIGKARRLEWWTLAWMGSVVIVMFLSMGSSQAMRTALIEDILSLVPAIVFLIASSLEGKKPTRTYPFGFHRVHSLAFLVSAVALSAVGSILLIEASMTLIAGDRVTIPPVTIAGRDIWLGWLMIAAASYSVIPPVLLGRMKLPLAKRLQDKVLHTDAMMQKADWMTGLATIAGVMGIALGYWWADAAAAAVISVSVIKDGIGALRSSVAELIDGAPRALENGDVAQDAEDLKRALEQLYPAADVRLRETGRYINAQVSGVQPAEKVDPAQMWPGPAERAWRLAQISFVPPSEAEDL